MVITSEIVCRTGTVRGQAKKNNVSIPRKTGKSTIVTHGTIRVNILIDDFTLENCCVQNKAKLKKTHRHKIGRYTRCVNIVNGALLMKTSILVLWRVCKNLYWIHFHLSSSKPIQYFSI